MVTSANRRPLLTNQTRAQWAASYWPQETMTKTHDIAVTSYKNVNQASQKHSPSKKLECYISPNQRASWSDRQTQYKQNKINVGMSMAVHFVVGYDKTVQFWLLEFSSFRRTRRYSTRPSTFIRKHRTVSTLLTVHFYRSSTLSLLDCSVWYMTVQFKSLRIPV